MRFHRLAVCVSLLAACQGAFASEPVHDKIDALDGQFRKLYGQTRKQFVDASSPVILAISGKLILFRNGKRDEQQMLNQKWQTLKTVDHVPLAIFVALVQRTDKPLDDAARNELAEFRQGIQQAQPQIADAGFGTVAAARQQQILNGSLTFLDSVLNDGSVSRAQLDAFAGSMGPLALANADDAEEIELSTVDRTVQQWRRQMTPAEWQRLSVVVCDSHMPRIGERQMQYFEALLKQNEEGHRLIYMENNNDEQKALDLLATHRLDSDAGRAFFHDPDRLHRDLLSDGARHYLLKHPPQP